MLYFANHYENISYPLDNGEKTGLRNAQIGAIHSIAAFFTLAKQEAAIVVMPTGAGKTAVLMLSPFLLRKEKVLVVTPSTMVRGQIAEDFTELKTLCKAGVFPDEMEKPKVYEMIHKFDEENISFYQDADVIVATPQCALTLSESEWAKDNIQMVEVDEAHHTPAKTWTEILQNLNKTTHILFTATPFRLDRKDISGEIIYNYPLSKAYGDGIFGEIQYVPVEVSENKDLMIAIKAEEVLLADKAGGLEHYLMVRTDSKKNAKTLDELYKENTRLRLKRVDSSMRNSYVKKCISELKAGDLDGIICVDMLGEGFDFPNLKIAAIHAPHKSLANTLQFIGRFARTNASNIGTAKFIAENDEELEIEHNRLYASDAVWQDIIINMSEGKNREEQSARNYYKEFIDQEGGTREQIPLSTLRPNGHTKIYRVKSFNSLAEFPADCNVCNRIQRNIADNTVIGIGLDMKSPIWAGDGRKIDKTHVLYIVHFQEETSMLHIYSQKHTENIYEAIAESFSGEYTKIPKSEIHRVLGNMKDFEIFNSGILNRYNESGEAYRISAGSDVSGAIDPDTGRMYSAGHVFCKAKDDATLQGENVTLGYSSASKVWSSAYFDLPDYIAWCEHLGKKIADSSIAVKTNTNFDYIPFPHAFTQYPPNIFMVDLSHKTYSSPPMIATIKDNKSCGRINDFKISLVNSTSNFAEVKLEVNGLCETLRVDIQGHYVSRGKVFYVQGTELMTLDQYFEDNPLIFKTTDETVIEGIEMYDGNPEVKVFDQNRIVPIDWEAYGTDVNVEFNKPDQTPVESIQDTLFKELKNQGIFKYIIFDHGTGEIADYIAIQETDMELICHLYHVKKKSGVKYNNTVGDIYEVAGQAVKSLIWVISKGAFISRVIERQQAGHCKVLVGSRKDLIKDLRATDKRFCAYIAIVQPSLSKSYPMQDKISEVLASASNYISHGGRVKGFEVYGSK